MKKRPTTSRFFYFYSRSLLIAVAVICIITLALTLIIGELLDKNEENRFFVSYDKALSDLHRGLETKQRNFYTELTPLFSKPGNYNTLIELLNTPTIPSIDPSLRVETVSILRDLSSRNRYCVGILLYSPTTDLLYRYDAGSQGMEVKSLHTDFFQGSSFTTNLLALSELKSLDNTLASSLFGLGGTLSRYQSSPKEQDSYIIFLYNLSELGEPLKYHNFPESAEFTLLNSRGNTVYSSHGDYETSYAIETILPYQSKTSKTIVTPAAKLFSENGDTYRGDIYSGRYEYLAFYEVPAALLGKSQGKTLAYLLSLSIFLISVFIYIVSFSRAHRKVRNIEIGMEHIGESNLTYRIPEPEGDDEYTKIIRGFNRMCDELEENIEKNYIYQLQQKQAELYAMQVSVDPHFLYNTLEMIRVQSLTGKAQNASQMILLLAKIYRNQVNRNLFVSIMEEIEHCENILCLYQYRFENVEFEISVSPEILHYALPRNTLQPLIENYFVHGFSAGRQNNYIHIGGGFLPNSSERMIQLFVEDNGNSISPERLSSLRERLKLSVFESQKDQGLALPNIHTRLRIVFGEESGVTLSAPSESSGFRAELIFPPVLPQDLLEREPFSLSSQGTEKDSVL